MSPARPIYSLCKDRRDAEFAEKVRRLKSCCASSCSLLFETCLERRFAAGLAFIYSALARDSGRRIRFGSHRVAANILRRSVAKHLVRFQASATACRRCVLLFAILIRRPRPSHLLPARLRLRADVVLILFPWHRDYLPRGLNQCSSAE